jgi:uncharacterized protein YjiS (DUF1127 family)
MRRSLTNRAAVAGARASQPPFVEFTGAADSVSGGILAGARALGALAQGAVAAARRWHERRQTIRALLDLDDHRLKDIGLSRSTILAAVRDQKEAMRRGWF